MRNEMDGMQGKMKEKDITIEQQRERIKELENLLKEQQEEKV